MHPPSWSCVRCTRLRGAVPFISPLQPPTAVAIALTAIATAIKLVTLPDGTVASDRAEFTSPSPLWLLPLMDTAKRAASCLTTCEMGHMPPGLNLSKGGDQRLRTETNHKINHRAEKPAIYAAIAAVAAPLEVVAKRAASHCISVRWAAARAEPEQTGWLPATSLRTEPAEATLLRETIRRKNLPSHGVTISVQAPGPTACLGAYSFRAVARSRLSGPTVWHLGTYSAPHGHSRQFTQNAVRHTHWHRHRQEHDEPQPRRTR